MTDGQDGRGFEYRVSEEDVREYQALSPADRLRWLYAINLFLWKFTPAKNRRVWNAMRDGTFSSIEEP